MLIRDSAATCLSASSVENQSLMRFSAGTTLVYLAEWMCKFNGVVAVLRQLSAQANVI